MKKYSKIKQHQKTRFFSVDVESIPGVPGASWRVPGAPQHRKIMKKPIFTKIIKKSIRGHGSKAFVMAISMVMTPAAKDLRKNQA